MAEASVQDVVNEAQSMGEPSSIDVTGNHLSASYSGEGDEQLLLQQYDEKEQPNNPDADHITTSTSAFSFTAASESNDLANKQIFPEHDNNSPHVADSNLVNGVDSASFTGSDDAGYQNLVANEGSFNSDPEPSQDPVSRVDRTSSVKKSTPFKSVSVTKNFLAKSGTTPTTMSKLGPDRAQGGSPASASSSQAPKPRLVAKSGKDARSINLSGGTSSGTGPDAGTVWNRNRPVPAPPPKQFTDEELKQQYGIHMATRLQADEAGKESKWADIDDDEDDWAPDTVQWMDGTKSTLLPSENQPTPSKPEVTQDPVASAEESSKNTLPQQNHAQSQSSISSIGKTILRPGARVTSNSQTRPGLVLKNVPDKPTQVEKPASQSSGRSPWAQLPPVDKSSPITFHPPPNTTARPTPPARRDSLVQEEQTAVTSPAKEIAADDFDRSWRDAGDRSGRELFNSQSGRYEPVKNVRRGSRHDGGFRPPAVLQRPSPQQNYPVPADAAPLAQSREPHPAAARRDSSSYGFGKPPNDRRLSMDPAGDVLAATISKGDQSGLPDASQVPSQGQFQDGQPPPLANTYSAHGPDAARQWTSAPDQDARTLQSQLMNERLEINRKRKQEEREREEAEKNARIRAKMEALGPPPQNSTQQTSSSSTQSPSLSKASEASPTSQSANVQQQQQENQTHHRQPPAPAESSWKSEHHSLEAPSVLETMDSSQSQGPPSKSPTVEHSAKKSLSDSNLSSAMTPEVQQLPGLGQPVPQDRQMSSWGRLPRGLEHANNWGSTHSASASANVWGPPSSDRPLGNGAFEHEVNRGPMQLSGNNALPQAQMRASQLSPSMQFDGAHPTPSPPPQLQHHQDNFPHHPPPPTTASPNNPNRPFVQQPIQPTAPPSFPSSGSEWKKPQDLAAAKRAWANFPAQLQKQEREESEKRRREWEAKKAEEARTGVKQPVPQYTLRETFYQTVPGDVLGERRVVAVTKRVHPPPSQPPPTQPAVDQQAVNAPVQPSFAPRPVAQPTPPHSINNARGSRFFGPSAERGPAMQVQPSVDEAVLFSGPPSPPPPDDSADHPVRAGEPGYPLVKIRPKATVKLPGTDDGPSMSERSTTSTEASPLPAPIRPPQQHKAALGATKPNPTVSRAVAVPRLSRNPSGQQATLNQQAWQHKFHALFHSESAGSPSTAPATAVSNTNTNVPKTASSDPSGAVVSSSTKTLFEVSAPSGTRVYLPNMPENVGARTIGTCVDMDSNAETKPTEEVLMEEREFGSAPIVRLFNGIHPREQEMLPECPPIHLTVGAKTPITLVEMQNPDFVRTAHMLSFEYLDEELFVSLGIRIKVRLLGKPVTERILAKRVNAHAQAQARKASARGTPRKSFGGVKTIGSKPSPRSDMQSSGGRHVSSSAAIQKRADENKMGSNRPMTPEQEGKTAHTAASVGGATGSSESMSEKSKPRKYLSRSPRSVRNKRPLANKT